MGSRSNSWAAGFVCGQAQAYCDQIRFGSRLAAQLAFPGSCLTAVARLVEEEGCVMKVERGGERVSVWIYRDPQAERLIDALDAAPVSPITVWAMGKLFGYGTPEVADYLATSASPEGSNWPLCSCRNGSRTARGCCPC